MVATVLAVDMGTTSTKVLAITAGGEVVVQRSRRYPLEAPAPGRAEQDPDLLRDTVLDCLTAVVAELDAPPRAVVFGSAMHGVLAVADDGRPLTPCWIWADRRSAPQAERLFRDGLAAGLYARTGTPVHAMAPLTKLLWLRENDPDTFARARRFVSIKEYVLHALCGEWLVDPSLASGTGLLDLRTRDWDAQALALCGVGPDRLSTLVPVRHRVPATTAPLEGVPLVVGASDGALANVGAGAITPDRLAVTLGTSGAVRAVVEEPVLDPLGRLFCFVLDERRYVVGGALDNVGRALAWLRNLTGVEVGALVDAAADLPPGADGLLCLPLLGGERFAAWRPDGTGIVLGLTHQHGSAHLARAVLESIGCGVAVIAHALARRIGAPTEVRLGGGIAESPAVRQLIADVLQVRCAMPGSRESSALGAAWLGWEALGEAVHWDSEAEVVHEPDPSRAEVYRRIGSLQQALYEANEPLMSDVARLRGRGP